MENFMVRDSQEVRTWLMFHKNQHWNFPKLPTAFPPSTPQRKMSTWKHLCKCQKLGFIFSEGNLTGRNWQKLQKYSDYPTRLLSKRWRVTILPLQSQSADLNLLNNIQKMSWVKLHGQKSQKLRMELVFPQNQNCHSPKLPAAMLPSRCPFPCF